MWIILTIFAFFPAIINCQQRDTYTAAVVEYFSVRNASLAPTARILANVDQYMDILNNIKQKMDIVVFPEATLTSGTNVFKRDILLESSAVIPSDTKIPPCESDDYAPFIKILSCGAKTHNTYLSVNLLEKQKCRKKCKHEDKWKVYNTNIVFDRKGNIVAKYRKYNLFGEKELDTTDKAERVTFTTDFNVTFGIFICFDIMFEDPAMELVKSGVKHFIYPNMWFSELSQLTSVQTHSMWSYANDVVLLSAGANKPKAASGGSVIYQGRAGALEFYISGTDGTKVLIQEVKKTWSSDDSVISECYKKPDLKHFTFWKENYENYTSELLDLQKTEHILCSNGACCIFNINATEKRLSNDNEFKYHIAMLSGSRWYYHQLGGTDSCIVMACKNEKLSSCGQRYTNSEGFFPFTFHNITVSIETKENKHALHYPNSLSGDFIPLAVDQFSWKEELLPGKKVKKTIVLQEEMDNIFTFGIFGRIYNNNSV